MQSLSIYHNEKYVQPNVIYKSEAHFMGHMLSYTPLPIYKR